ncbi:ABC transporter domain-containing protein [Mycena indigotica]|uniref:ABC transporter domain-containing protein n=1 Tax=Mycena indigotica TaxID=2126181 RepID=A0A8H6SDN7_9AGAR|nr:ABC transporter domain-containing protein [Mycena indigotica]KAF7297037.1 ABC transporter domain-containing protein [Mycena indigotica]
MSTDSVISSPERLNTKNETRSAKLAFRHLSYRVQGTKDKGKVLVDNVSVLVKPGELLAIMGPSGAGKSTLLDLMAFRKPALAGGKVQLNGDDMTAEAMQKISTFVEQEDALIGVLTVRESVSYALRLHLPLLSRRESAARVNQVLSALGLQSCADQRIGTPISRGISGGQKRRVTAACAMVTFPRLLLLDEVTSGLDSTSAYQVVGAIRALARAEGMFVIASIHQPSLETLSTFDNLLLLAPGGVTCYNGPVDGLAAFMERWGHPVGRFSNPSDHAMAFLSTDFAGPEEGTTTGHAMESSAHSLRQFYLAESASIDLVSEDSEDSARAIHAPGSELVEYGKATPFVTLVLHTLILAERTTINYARNLLAYGVRAGMYAGMGAMLALIWINLGTADSTINDRLSVHFYSVAFLAFMSVAGIPSFLEERAVYYRESKNGLYTTLPFVLSNTLVNMPFLFFCVLLFSVISYWAIGLHAGASAFFRFLAFLYLAILAAESQVQIVAALVPIFVAALAIGAFINGFWMSVGGYFIKARSLPRFWFYSFHYMDYQRYAFELLANSDLRGLTFRCTDSCACAYPSSAPDTCTVSGDDVLSYLDVGGISYGKWSAVLIGITVLYRIGLYVALRTRSG